MKISTRLCELFDDAAHHLASVRDLWDSWDSDAVIKDATSGRYIDRHKLHTLHPNGRNFRPQGPSITPRPPQGQPIIAALAHAPIPYRLAVREADIVFITPHSGSNVTRILADIDNIAQHHRPVEYLPIKTFVDLTVVVEGTGSSNRRRTSLDTHLTAPWTSDSLIFTGTAQELADLIEHWHALGIDSFRLRPAVLPTDLHRINDELVPILQERNLRPQAAPDGTLRTRLGLPEPESRFR